MITITYSALPTSSVIASVKTGTNARAAAVPAFLRATPPESFCTRERDLSRAIVGMLPAISATVRGVTDENTVGRSRTLSRTTTQTLNVVPMR